MSEHDIRHFLVTYDPVHRKATVQEFGTDYDAALDAYEGRRVTIDVLPRRQKARECPLFSRLDLLSKDRKRSAP